MTVPYDFAPAARQIAVLADGVSDDQFDRPTPCPGWSVAMLLHHLLDFTVAFANGARKQIGLAPEPTADLPPDWRDQLRFRLDDLVSAWRDPDAWLGEATVGGVALPADLTAAVLADELVVHGWDLAEGTGQPYGAEPELVAAALGFAEKFSDLEGGPFGPSVAVPAGADALRRLLGLTGRDVNWRR
jgi:uncharacterized protein (TIGR03086 family)